MNTQNNPQPNRYSNKSNYNQQRNNTTIRAISMGIEDTNEEGEDDENIKKNYERGTVETACPQ